MSFTDEKYALLKLQLSDIYGKQVKSGKGENMIRRVPVIREDIFNAQLQELSRVDLIDWCLRAVDIVKSGIACKLTKDNVTVYKVKNIIRVDVKVE